MLVTGGCGFLGRYIVEKLRARGYGVRVFDMSILDPIDGVEYVRGNLTLKDDVVNACAGVDTVIHVASLTETWGDYAKFVAVNVEGTRNVIAACLANDVSGRKKKHEKNEDVVVFWREKGK